MRPHALGYGAVLLLVAVSIVVQMILTASDGVRFATLVLQAATLVAAVRASGVRHRDLRAAALAAVVVVIASAIAWAVYGDIPTAPAAIVNGLLVAVAPVAIVRGLLQDLRDHGVTPATLAGVLAIYLLVGMFFSFLYGAVDAIDSDALFAQIQSSSAEDRLYFSFVTLCTLGYGDLTPLDPVPRTFAVAEMLVGQIYLVTIVSLIVTNLPAARRR